MDNFSNPIVHSAEDPHAAAFVKKNCETCNGEGIMPSKDNPKVHEFCQCVIDQLPENWGGMIILHYLGSLEEEVEELERSKNAATVHYSMLAMKLHGIQPDAFNNGNLEAFLFLSSLNARVFKAWLEFRRKQAAADDLEGLNRLMAAVNEEDQPATEEAIEAYMIEVVVRHVDLHAMEVNSASLALDAFKHFNKNVASEDDIPEVFFELAAKVASNKEEELELDEGRNQEEE